VAIGSRSEFIRADRQHAASARARVRDRSHNARLVQGLVVVREDQGDHQANELTRRAIATSRSIRSEGLGLALAEAMMLSKPSIATAYSGNLDFMDESNSLLVGYDLTEIETTAGPYEKGNRWAEPSIPEAANAMRWVFNHPEEARLLGERARLTTNHYFSPQLCGSRMLDRLNQVRGERSKT